VATKTKNPQTRAVRLVRPLGSEANGDGLVSITVGGEVGLYWIAEVPTGVEGHRAFSLSRLCSNTEYRCTVGERLNHCTCKAGQHNLPCKHRDAILALIAKGKV
jgi:hypothetical protein